jgi:hypothetical protein
LREHATAQHAGVLDFEPQHATACSDFAPVWLILQGAEISFSFSHSFQAIRFQAQNQNQIYSQNTAGFM